MGFKQAAVLTPVCFFLGVLFICFNVDHRLLFVPLTDEAIQDGFKFYTTFYNAPPAIKALLHAMAGVGIAGLTSKLHKWTESAMLFDGSCLAAYVFTLAVYLAVNIPALRTIVVPADVDTREDQVEALRVLSAGNVIMAICLVGILFMQAGQEYAGRMEAKQEARVAAEEQTKLAAEKKDE